MTHHVLAIHRVKRDHTDAVARWTAAAPARVPGSQIRKEIVVIWASYSAADYCKDRTAPIFVVFRLSRNAEMPIAQRCVVDCRRSVNSRGSFQGKAPSAISEMLSARFCDMGTGVIFFNVPADFIGRAPLLNEAP